MKQQLTVELLCKEASIFAETESAHAEPAIFGITDGKAVGTYLEHKFQTYLRERYTYEADKTADYQITTGIRNILENNGNQDDIVAFMQDRLLPVEEIQAQQIAEEIMTNPPKIGYLTISNALQWRLQYRRVIEEAGRVDGMHKIR